MEKRLNILVQGSLLPHTEPELPGVPTPWSCLKADSDRWAAALMVEFQQAFGRAYMAPPDVPAEAVKILRDAFSEVRRDPEFLADAQKLRIDITPQAGEDIQQVVERLYSAPRAVVDRLRQIVEP